MSTRKQCERIRMFDERMSGTCRSQKRYYVRAQTVVIEYNRLITIVTAEKYTNCQIRTIRSEKYDCSEEFLGS